MLHQTDEGAGIAHLRSLPNLRLEPAVSPATMVEHMRSALSRGLPRVKTCKPHGHKMCVLAGGPSLGDTVAHRAGYLAAVNGSLRWLLERDIVPNACGVLDPGAHMAEMIEVHRGVTYFVASICHPAVFDKLIEARCHAVLWHPSGSPECEELLQTHDPEGWFMVAGGCTMGLRWFNLGYVCGFRDFAFHGIDSSFRGGATHAYADRADAKEWLEIAGRSTRLNFVNQVQDFFAVLKRFGMNDMQRTGIEVFGDGLLQDAVDHHLRERGGLFGVRATLRRNLGGLGGSQPDLAA